MKFKLFGLMLIIVAAMVALIACSSSDEAVVDKEASQAAPVLTKGQQAAVPKAQAAPAKAELTYLKAIDGDAQYGGRLQWGFLANPPHLDLHQSGTTNNVTPQGPMFDLLVMNNPNEDSRTVIPQGLATGWDISSDGMTFTFPLREGVKFHDGAAMTSADVLATFDRIMFPPDHVSSRREALFNAVDSISAPDANTFQIVLAEPRPADYILNSLANGFNVIVRKQTLDDSGSDLRNIPDYPGTGPFKYVQHTDAEQWELEKNVDYWNPNLPYFDGIDVYHMSDAQARVAAMLSKQSDWVRILDPGTYHKWSADTPPGMKIFRYGQTTVQALWMNQKGDGPLTDVRVRKAMNLVLDRQAMEDSVFKTVSFNGFGCGYVYRWSPWAASYEDLKARSSCRPASEAGSDIAEAKELMAAAGYADGFDIEFKYSSEGHYAVWGPIISQMLNDHLGINVKQTPLEGAVAIQSIQDGNFEISTSYAVFPFADPSAYMRAWYGCGSQENYGGFCDQEVDALLDKIDSELDTDTRKGLVTELDLLLHERVPFATVGWEEFADAHWDYVKGHTADANVGIYNAERRGTWWIDASMPSYER